VIAAACGSGGGTIDAPGSMKDAPADSSRDAGPVCLGDPTFTGGPICIPAQTQMVDITADMTISTVTDCALMQAQTTGAPLCVVAGTNVKIKTVASTSRPRRSVTRVRV